MLMKYFQKVRTTLLQYRVFPSTSLQVGALCNTVGQGRSSSLYVGAVKTNVSHLEGAAGIAGLLKVPWRRDAVDCCWGGKGEGLSNFGVVEYCCFLMVVDVGVCILYAHVFMDYQSSFGSFVISIICASKTENPDTVTFCYFLI